MISISTIASIMTQLRIVIRISRLLYNYRPGTLFLLSTFLLLTVLPYDASATRWEKLARSGHYEVSLDGDAVRLTTSGRLALWLKFIPLSESSRRRATVQYKNNKYRQHLEYFEVNCVENSAKKGFTDIIGLDGKRLNRIRGEGSQESITPGSVLDSAAKQICPADDDDWKEDPAAEDSQNTNPENDVSTNMISVEAQEIINNALKLVEAEPLNHAAWAELGNAYYDADMPKQAIDSYNRSLTLKPDNADVLNDQGAMFRQTGDIPQALKNFEKALAIDSYNLESLYNTGYIYAFDQGNIERALVVWRHYLELDSSSETARQVQSFIDTARK